MITEITDQRQYESIWARERLSFLQSWQWGELKRQSSDVVRLLVDDVVVTVFVKRLGALPCKYGYLPRPFSDTTLTNDQLKQLSRYLYENFKLTHIVVDPASKVGLASSNYESAGFSPAGQTVQPNQTRIIDLTLSEDQLFTQMTSTYRKKIRRAEKHGCTIEIVRASDSSAIKRFYPIVEEIYARTDYVMFGKAYYKRIWEIFEATGGAVIVFVKYRGRDIGGLFYVNSVDTANELYGGVVAEGLPLQANYLLKWAGIRHAKTLGLTRYDMWGVGQMVNGSYLPNDPLYNISLFKKDFGGLHVTFLPQQIKVFKRIPYLIYRAGLRMHIAMIRARKVVRHHRRKKALSS